MISFSKLGNYGRLGNQLFQYAFLRVSALRLNTKFFCPHWEGDDIFNLHDEHERTIEQKGIVHHYLPKNAGYAEDALSICDHTEIEGFYQSEKYYPQKQLVRDWYCFKEEIVMDVENKYGDILKSDCVSISLRLDTDYAKTREYFPQLPLYYYRNSIGQVKSGGVILVFSDRPDLAKKYLRRINDKKFIFITDLHAHKQLYLMTRCRVNIITNSTFAWWGAWLNSHPGKIVITPESWCRPGVPDAVADILCEDWIKMPNTRWFIDDFSVWRIRHPIDTFNRIYKRHVKR